MLKQYRLKIDTKFSETKPAGLATKYLNSGEIDQRAGVEIAIACLFAPLGATLSGASRLEIEKLIAASRTQSETYFALALNRCDEDLTERQLAKKETQNYETNSIAQSRNLKDSLALSNLVAQVGDIDLEENTNIDHEEF
jgi:hypothetical protein